MLWFIGTGISGYRSIPSRGLQLIREADTVYLEQFTSPIGGADLLKIKKDAGGEFRIARRWMVEDGREILKNAKRGKVALVSYGDPYAATTHIELRTRAIREKIRTGTVHGSSAIASVIGECGLHHYKIGRLATVMGDPKSATTPYYVTYRNLIEGNHTVLLLEYDQDRDFFLDPGDALSCLLDAEKEQRRCVVGPDTFAIVASRIGLRGQRIVSGRVSRLQNADLGRPPHTIVIPGRMHFTETDALRALTVSLDEPADNSDGTKRIAAQMVEKYAPLIRDAMDEFSRRYGDIEELKPVLENAALYVRDAESFLQEGKDEVAILSIGYADGLVDALRMAKGMET